MWYNTSDMRRAFFLIALTFVFCGVAVSEAQTPPSAPNLVQVKADSSCRAALKWMQPDEADSFIMSVNGGPGMDISGSCPEGPCTNLEYKQDFLNPGSAYDFRIKARRSPGGDSAWSQEKSLTMPPVEAPDRPGPLFMEWLNDGDGLTVSWEEPDGVTNGGYRVYYRLPGSEDFVPVALQDEDERFYYDTFDPESSHAFRVKAYETGAGCDISSVTQDDDGIGAFSDFSTALVVPAVPGSVLAEASQSEGVWDISFSWSGVSTATKYELDVSTDQNFSSLEYSYEIPSGSTSQVVPGVSPNQTYHYRLRAVNETGGNTGYSIYYPSDPISVGLPSPGELKAEYSFNRYASDAAGSEAIRLTWTDNATLKPRTIEIFEAVDGGSYPSDPSETVDISGPGPTLPEDQEITITRPRGSSYKFKARVSSGNAVSAWSNEQIVDLRPVNISPQFLGEAWSAHAGSEGTGGIGWISLAGDRYKVGVDADIGDGTLTGMGWASVSGGEGEEWGWLVFDPEYLSGRSARLDAETGEVSGWARFICMESGSCGTSFEGSGWDGWVRLRGTTGTGGEYGLCFGGATGDEKPLGGETYMTGASCGNDYEGEAEGPVGGMAWGGPLGGWIVFGAKATAPDGGDDMYLTPADPTVVIREKIEISSNLDVESWYVNNVEGGNNAMGTVVPSSPRTAVYTAPDNLPQNSRTFTVSAVSVAREEAETYVGVRSYGYTASCTTLDDSSIRIRWTPLFKDPPYGVLYAKHSLNLQGNISSPTAPSTEIGPIPQDPRAGTYVHEGLIPGTRYDYSLDVEYDNPPLTVDGSVISCVTAAEKREVDDTPTRVGAYGTDAHTIYLNWKDNATSTAPYRFEVQRIKVTPATTTEPVFLYTDSNEVRLYWENMTTSTPFYFQAERSTSTAANRFKTWGGDRDPSRKLISFTEVGHADMDTPPNGSETEFSVSDNQVQEATTYYYRLRACSYINVGSAYIDPASGGIGNPDPVCSWYAPFDKSLVPGEGVSLAMATTTLPNKPRNATSTPDAEDQITIRWDDMSFRETGYQILRNGVEIEDEYPGASATGTIVYVDDDLSPGTSYTYRIRARYDIPASIPAQDGGGGVMYSNPVETTTHTHFRVRVGIAGDGGGSVSGSLSCPGNCTDYFPWDTDIYLSANSDANSTFTDWGGDYAYCDGGSGSPTCSFDGDVGNVSLDANFRADAFLLTINAIGSGVVTGPVGINCSNTGGACSAYIDRDTEITLRATPDEGYVFGGWTGLTCTEEEVSPDSGFCTFAMGSNVSAGAEFNPEGAAGEGVIGRIAGGVGDVFRGIFPGEEIKKVSSGSANALSALEETWKRFKEGLAGVFRQGESILGEYVKKTAEKAVGQTAEPLDGYFEMFKASGGGPVTTTTPVFVDKGLDPDSVYLYRVRVVYDNDPHNPGEWGNLVAGKTLRETGSELSEENPICTRNSFCDYTIKKRTTSNNLNFDPPVEESESQCTVNSDCREVGRQDYRYQER